MPEPESAYVPPELTNEGALAVTVKQFWLNVGPVEVRHVVSSPYAFRCSTTYE